MEKDYVKFPNFSQNAANFPNSMGLGLIPKKGCESSDYIFIVRTSGAIISEHFHYHDYRSVIHNILPRYFDEF